MLLDRGVGCYLVIICRLSPNAAEMCSGAPKSQSKNREQMRFLFFLPNPNSIRDPPKKTLKKTLHSYRQQFWPCFFAHMRPKKQ